ncbi:hypothetical protein Agub_g7172 [Astrephomene gubernaculifera]|uniref:Guanylate cyclase domain-containing protein n=1 Tax=Astrephomene gubernaculifera TaxID=47775 RepID=A0AAD3HM33_9CHLO|nr:hypothetical protein Agub_g7172 [Astrephomene gubernaculifera]
MDLRSGIPTSNEDAGDAANGEAVLNGSRARAGTILSNIKAEDTPPAWKNIPVCTEGLMFGRSLRSAGNMDLLMDVNRPQSAHALGQLAGALGESKEHPVAAPLAMLAKSESQTISQSQIMVDSKEGGTNPTTIHHSPSMDLCAGSTAADTTSGTAAGTASGTAAAGAFNLSSGQGSPLGPATSLTSSWVDTETLWTAVQRNGQELQRRQRIAEELRPSRASCVRDVGVVATRRVDAAWRRFGQRVRTQLVVMARVAVKDPYTVVVPLILLMCLLGFGLWGVMSISSAISAGRRQEVLNSAVDFSASLTSHIAATVAPASTVKTLIELDPDWRSINDTFFEVAPKLFRKGKQQTEAILTIVLAPQGIVSAIVPSDLPAWQQVYGLDLLKNLSWRADALKTVALHQEGMVMTGPTRLRAGMMGIVTRYAVFIDGAGPNETFGFPGSAYDCAPCYEEATATTPSSRFWGFAQLNVDWEILIRNTTRMYDLCDFNGLTFNMTYIDPVTHVNRSIASCGDLDPNPVIVEINTMHNRWVLAMSDARGWTPNWLPWVLAVVVVMSVWLAAAMAVILINRREHMWLLQAMLPKKVIATLRRGEEYAEAFECVTVLFSDIVSYTTIASGMEPIKVVRLLNEMYSAFDALVDQYECFKVETIGDAFMAVCGTQGEDAVSAAVRIARLAQAMVERTRVLVSADGQKIQIRIGIHSGPVVGAVVGFKMPHFCLCGDTVNTASRVETTSLPMCIQVSESTAALLAASRAGFQLRPRGPVEMKGKGALYTHWLLQQQQQQQLASSNAGGGAVTLKLDRGPERRLGSPIRRVTAGTAGEPEEHAAAPTAAAATGATTPAAAPTNAAASAASLPAPRSSVGCCDLDVAGGGGGAAARGTLTTAASSSGASAAAAVAASAAAGATGAAVEMGRLSGVSSTTSWPTSRAAASAAAAAVGGGGGELPDSLTTAGGSGSAPWCSGSVATASHSGGGRSRVASGAGTGASSGGVGAAAGRGRGGGRVVSAAWRLLRRGGDAPAVEERALSYAASSGGGSSGIPHHGENCSAAAAAFAASAASTPNEVPVNPFATLTPAASDACGSVASAAFAGSAAASTASATAAAAASGVSAGYGAGLHYPVSAPAVLPLLNTPTHIYNTSGCSGKSSNRKGRDGSVDLRLFQLPPTNSRK